MNENLSSEKIVWSTCNVNCGSRCPLRLHVKDGRVVQVTADNQDDNSHGIHQIRACLRGRGIRKWIYSPDRILYPMKRIGKRGEGKFTRISWDEAFRVIGSSLSRTIKEYGNEAVYRHYGSGNLGGVVSHFRQIDRLMNILGGYLSYYNSYSTAQISHAMTHLYGKVETGNYISDTVNSKLVVLFGNNPAETRMSGGGTVRDMARARQNGRAKVIVIDPMYTDTVTGFADEWIPIRPGTDAALASAIAFILITRNRVDIDFLNHYCQGYDATTMPKGIPEGNSYKEYILGRGEDRILKTPAWASAITGIPHQRIVALASEIGAAKPAYIAQGWGPQRQANGEQTAKAICMLAILTGNVGISGGNTGDREGPFGIAWPEIPVGDNPVKASIPCFLWTRAIENPSTLTRLNSGLRGKDRLEVPLKFLWCFASNMLINQHSDIRHTHDILQDENRCEMIVLIDNVMTASARYADILLPGTSSFEEMDLAYQGYAVEMGALMMREQAIDPMGECKTVFDICAGVANELGVKDQFTLGMSHAQWVEHMYHECRRLKPELPEQFSEALKKGVFKWPKTERPHVGLASFRKDPDRYPLSTPSGKIEIFSTTLWEMGRTWELPEGDRIRAIPEFHRTWGMPGSNESRKYPLQLIGFHGKQRTHSSYGNNPWLKEASPQMLWINPMDADSRGISHGDRVRVFNATGETRVKAKVTQRIMPGVLSLAQGAWFTPGLNGTDDSRRIKKNKLFSSDHGGKFKNKDDCLNDNNGCINMLTRQRPSPIAKGNPQHTNMVQVVKENEIKK